MSSLDKTATTVPAVLAARYGVSGDTIYRWRGRTNFEDRSHTAHQLATTLTSAQEAVAVELRWMLLLPLDDLLAVTREFLNPDVSRSGLDRCLRRHRVSNLNALRPRTPAEPHKAFKTCEPGFLHIDVKFLPQMADGTTRSYLFVATDRAIRWVFVRFMPARTAANARKFLRDMHRACPIRIARILTQNGKEFTDRLFASRARAPSGAHEFDLLCSELGIEHRLTPPKSPTTNGMVESFNGRIADVPRTNGFDSAQDQCQTVKEVAERLKVAEATVRHWIKIGDLRAIGIGKGWRIADADLGAFLRLHETAPKRKGHDPDDDPTVGAS